MQSQVHGVVDCQILEKFCQNKCPESNTRRLWCIDHSGGHLGHVAAEFDTGLDAPLRMALPPSCDCILLALGSGGAMRITLDIKAKPPAFTEYKGTCLHALIAHLRAVQKGYRSLGLMLRGWQGAPWRLRGTRCPVEA